MSRLRTALSLSAFYCGAALAASFQGPAPSPPTPSPEERAVAFLAREVPRWSAERGCFSCHNNGDGARALYDAARAGLAIPPGTLESTTRWLEGPEGWESNRGDPRASDKGLARIQFAAALESAVAAGRASRDALARAAELVAGDQRPDGSWQIDAPGTFGSPATYGSALATAVARRVLDRAGSARFAGRTGAAESWLRRLRAESVLDASATLHALSPAGLTDTEVRRCRDILARGQARDGGWGPTIRSAPEVFDTAVALVGLASLRDDPEAGAMIRRGRAYLVATQQADGSWPETTRPPLGESYAQRVSTAAWALVALLATR